ncbi:hypothetical protein KC338_g214 [Hortaea werneckii]|nr:hypothetical protein KC338_g214 [Hortaea werneckii]
MSLQVGKCNSTDLALLVCRPRQAQVQGNFQPSRDAGGESAPGSSRLSSSLCSWNAAETSYGRPIDPNSRIVSATRYTRNGASTVAGAQTAGFGRKVWATRPIVRPVTIELVMFLLLNGWQAALPTQCELLARRAPSVIPTVSSLSAYSTELNAQPIRGGCPNDYGRRVICVLNYTREQDVHGHRSRGRWQDARAMKAVISIARVWQVSFRRYLLYLANDSDRALQAMLRSHSPFAIRHSPIYLSHFAVARPAGQAAVTTPKHPLSPSFPLRRGAPFLSVGARRGAWGRDSDAFRTGERYIASTLIGHESCEKLAEKEEL